MSVGYSAVQWSHHKRVYDAIAAGAAAGYIAAFLAIGKVLWHGQHAISDEILVMRALGSCAIVLLHVILCIGPLARLDARFLPVLYNRRHLGVMTFLIALSHAALAIGYYHGFGVVNPAYSLLTSSASINSFASFPFEWLGLGALLIMFLMASTSHDFWLRNLSSRTWKRLHMLVYVAYALLIGHVALGALQTNRGDLAPILMGLGLLLVCGLHLAAARREHAIDRGQNPATSNSETWLDAGPVASIPKSRARSVCAPGGERIAVFRHAGGVSAVTNTCAHQGGPLSEGRVIDGCITCPWHGWQYKPGDGCSPPPFQEKIATYQIRIVQGRAEVNTRPLPPGTPVEPARLGESDLAGAYGEGLHV
ncbi:MAG: ferric reductase-like transmembrane domain-containing protein [Phycisphaeraceae bacterium]|nr:ferric reductase-like transmembrane domain-containing protein [Phycisphaeraceae bacterium]